MSIYATNWILKFPLNSDVHSDCEWVEVIGQGVPSHIGMPTPGYGYESVDPYASFLPPAVNVSAVDDGLVLRAMVIVKRGTKEVCQEYDNPLLVLSGTEYGAIPFVELHKRICDALRGDSPKLVVEIMDKDGSRRLMYDDGSSREL